MQQLSWSLSRFETQRKALFRHLTNHTFGLTARFSLLGLVWRFNFPLPAVGSPSLFGLEDQERDEWKTVTRPQEEVMLGHILYRQHMNFTTLLAAAVGQEDDELSVICRVWTVPCLNQVWICLSFAHRVSRPAKPHQKEAFQQDFTFLIPFPET